MKSSSSINLRRVIQIGNEIINLPDPLIGLTSPLEDWCDEMLVLELGVVLIPELGDPGFTSLLGVEEGLVVPLVSVFTVD